MLLRLLKRNPLHQITPTQLPFLLRDLVSNAERAIPQTGLSPFTVPFFSSVTSNLRKVSPKHIFDFLHSYGFTDTQIERRIINNKSWSVRSTETIKPKLDHLLAYGFSPFDLVRTICFDPIVLRSSLKERIEPNLNLLEATFGSKTHIIKAIIRGPWLITHNLEKNVIPSVKILRENGITTDKIVYLFTKFPRVLVKDPNVIIETIGKLKGMGMSPSTVAFLQGMISITQLKKETWERKMELYQSLGWSERDTLSAFSRQPMCLRLSDDKIKKNMKFFNEKLQWDSTMVLKWPIVLMFSLEGRTIPRCAVLNVLAKNGLWEGKPKISLFTMSEKIFKERFVHKFEKEVPQVIEAYQGKIDFVGFEPFIGEEHQV